MSSPLDRAATLVAVRLTRRRLDELTQLRGSSTGTPSSSNRGIAVAEHEPDVVVGQLDPGGLRRVEREAALGEDGLDQAELAMDGDPRVGGAEEAEDRIAAVMEQRRREGQRRIVGRLQPELEDDGGRPLGVVVLAGLVVGALVETQAEQPGGARAALEAAVDPVGEPALERAEAGVGRQLRLGRREPVEEELGSARPGAHESVAQPDPRGAKPVARDLVDGARVEIVDERVAIAVERVGADLGQGRCDGVERLLDRLVDGRAPVGEPGAAAVLELRVKKALRDRAVRRGRGRRTSLGQTRRARGRAACRPAARSAP